MAIIDGTTYGLTGAQVKELPEKVRAAGYKILTSADYNWNTTAGDSTTTPFDAVAMWLMPAGNYQWDTTIQPITVILDPSGTAVPVEEGMTGSFIFTRGASQHFEVPAQSVEADVIPIIMYNTGQLYDEYSTYSGRIEIVNGDIEAKIYLNGKKAINVLNYTQPDAAERALSAQMGKTLNDKIEGRIKTNAGAPTTSTVGTVGQLLEDTTNGKLYICTSISGGTYTWTEVGASGAGVEFIDLSPTSVSDTTINVTSPKTTAETEALAAAGKNIIFRIYVSQAIGGFLPGYYYIPSIWISSSYVWGSGIMNGGEFMYRQTSTGGYSGTIELREISPTEFTTNEWNALWA